LIVRISAGSFVNRVREDGEEEKGDDGHDKAGTGECFPVDVFLCVERKINYCQYTNLQKKKVLDILWGV